MQTRLVTCITLAWVLAGTTKDPVPLNELEQDTTEKSCLFSIVRQDTAKGSCITSRCYVRLEYIYHNILQPRTSIGIPSHSRILIPGVQMRQTPLWWI